MIIIASHAYCSKRGRDGFGEFGPQTGPVIVELTGKIEVLESHIEKLVEENKRLKRKTK